MNIKKMIGIPEINIEDFQTDISDLLIMRLEDLHNKYSRIYNSSHRLGFYKLVLIIKGEAQFWIDSNKYKYHSKSLIALSKGQVEFFENTTHEKGFVIMFSEEYINKYPGDLEWLNGLQLFNSTTENSLLKLSEFEFQDLENLFKKISMEFKSEDGFAKDEIIITMIKAVLILSERNKRIHASKNEITSVEMNYISEFQRKIGECYSNSKAVGFFADLLNITPRKLNRITKNILGKPAKRLIEERIILESKRLLVHTDRSMKEIGHTLGFSDPTNFNKFFKKFTRITPAEYRISRQYLNSKR